MLDFSNADDQREFANGPVPAGSIVVVEMEILQPFAERQAQDNQYISVSRNGLRQIYCQFTVCRGTYNGVSFRQNITLPQTAQNIALSPNFQKACDIGSSQLKAICLAAGKPPRIQRIIDMNHWRFPVKVKINQTPRTGDDGRVFWNNELALIITPDKEEYKKVRNDGEIINPNGAIAGREEKSPKDNGGSFADPFGPSENNIVVDEVPF